MPRERAAVWCGRLDRWGAGSRRWAGWTVDGGLVEHRHVGTRAGPGCGEADSLDGDRRLELLRSRDDERRCDSRSGVVIVVVEQAVMVRVVFVEVAMDDRPARLRGVHVGSRQH